MWNVMKHQHPLSLRLIDDPEYVCSEGKTRKILYGYGAVNFYYVLEAAIDNLEKFQKCVIEHVNKT